MTIHIIKLCVGADSLTDLANWQKQRLHSLKKPELIHVTRNTPRRAEELLDGGSLYWVINGWICARQEILELRPLTRDGIPHCGLVYDKKLIRTEPRLRRAFQGWRYLQPKDAPPDLKKSDKKLSNKLLRELAELGLV